MEQIGTFKRAGLQWLSSNKHIIQIFSNQPQTACNNMDGCCKCCEIDTVSLTFGSLQLLYTVIEKIDGCSRCRQIKDFIQYIHSWNQRGIIISNYDISLLRLLLCKNSKFERMCGYNCSFIIEKESFIKGVAATGIANWLNTFQIHVKYIVYTQFMDANALLKNIPYPLRNEWPQLLL